MDAEFYRKRTPILPPDESQIATAVSTVEWHLARITSDLKSALSDIKAAFSDLKTEAKALGELLVQVKQPERLDSDKSYCLLGVKWWGLGTFIREQKVGRLIKAKKANRVSAGSIIYNRLFAFRGSFAVVPQEHDGCYVSGEFPTFAVREGIDEPGLVASYIVHCMNSPQYLDEVDRISTGSTKTSRNRYKEPRFLEMRVAMPIGSDKMRDVVGLLERSIELRRQQASAMDELENLTLGITKMLPMAPDDEIAGPVEAPKQTRRKIKRP